MGDSVQMLSLRSGSTVPLESCGRYEDCASELSENIGGIFAHHLLFVVV